MSVGQDVVEHVVPDPRAGGRDHAAQRLGLPAQVPVAQQEDVAEGVGQVGAEEADQLLDVEGDALAAVRQVGERLGVRGRRREQVLAPSSRTS